MNDDQFQRLCNTFGFAPSRALREMLDEVTKQEQDRVDTLYAMYEQACQHRDQLLDAQRATIAAMRGKTQ